VREQSAQQQRQLVGGRPGVGLDPPRVDQPVLVEAADDRVGVADVYREQHGAPSA
jgi:hypothetical protein